MGATSPLATVRRSLGETGLSVSPIGLGTVKLGRNTGLKYPRSFELPDDDHARRLLETAQGLGINLIDTAPAYGVSEQRLGSLLPGDRDDWVIVTKAGEEFDGERSRYDFSAAAVTASVHRSLERLGTGHLDCVLLHSDGNDVEILERSGGVEALERLRERGDVRAIGISSKTPEGAILAIERPVDVVMITLNPLQAEDLPAVYAAKQRGVGVLVKKALVSGHVGRDAPGAGGAQTAPTPERCLGFSLNRPGVTAIIVGTINAEHLRENVSTAARVLGEPTPEQNGAADAGE